MKQRRSMHALGNYHALVWKEGDWFVSRCVEIEIASQGKTKQKALDNLREAIELLLEDCGNTTAQSTTFDQLELHRLGAFAM